MLDKSFVSGWMEKCIISSVLSQTDECASCVFIEIMSPINDTKYYQNVNWQEIIRMLQINQNK